jgi:diguanylate cyclase (GGDEF)-like protein
MQTALPEAALETLAAVFRTMPHYPLFDEPSAAALYGDYEGWALHLLTGAPPPGLVAAPSPQRQWGQAQLFFREHRVAEQVRVQHREREYSALAQDLLVALRDASAASGALEGVFDASLQRVQALLASNSVDQLRVEFAGMATQLRSALASQRTTLERQVGELRERLHAAEQAKVESELRARELGSTLAELRQALDEARQQMQIDPLTRLYNRGAFDAALRRYVEISQASGQTLALVLLDLDHFKAINDRYGHPVGDAVLTAFADLLSRSFLRADDLVARCGGEEFAVLLFVNDTAQVARLIETLFERLRGLRLPMLQDGVLTCSGGYALLGPGGNGDELVRRADQALYQAKRDGRDRFNAAA